MRLASTGGIQEAIRRLDDAYALEATIRRLTSSPLDVPPSAGHSQQSGSNRLLTARLGNNVPVAPQMSAPREPHQGYAQPSSRGSVPPPPNPMTQSSNPSQGGSMSASQGQRADVNSILPPPASAMGTGGFDAFEAKLRPTIFGLPGLHVAALAIGTFVLVLVLMWILMG